MLYVVSRTSEQNKRIDLQQKPCKECELKELTLITPKNVKTKAYVISLNESQLLSFINKYNECIISPCYTYENIDYMIEIYDDYRERNL
jgi:hypothetical protein